MDNILRFNSYSDYLQKKYLQKTFRVSVDGGFSCPNRKDRNSGGCIYCDADGARAAYLDTAKEIKDQITRGISFLTRRYNAKIFLLYFQAFSGTYREPEKLKELWDFALSLHDFRELIISTRPDCIDDIKADLIASYIKKDFEVWVELGLQSSNNKTLEKIKRGHTCEDFEKAFTILKNKKIKIAVHLIAGLPCENYYDMINSVKYVAMLKPDGIKFHNLNVAAGTELAEQYLKGLVTVPALAEYVNYLADSIELLPPETVIMRLTCDTPQKKRLAPEKNFSKNNVLDLLNKELEKRGSFQGKLYN
jgi:radical SAM protein (TIGR01212 family)